MAKLIILLACVTLGLFGTTQSISFECSFSTGGWATLGNVYRTSVRNSVSITSPDGAQIDSAYGAHQPGYNNDNVEAITVTGRQIHYFPRGLDKIFKNLKGIQIYETSLKEVHQSDLKAFPNLKSLYLQLNSLEILEENLFEFNPNLDYILLHSNKISYIDPNVFDKLTKLKSLNLQSNTCIDMYAVNNPTEVQNVIKAAKSQCTNSDYSKLEQKVKNLEIESKNLNSDRLKEKLQNLENQLKNSNYPNFFQDRLQDLKSAQALKSQEEATTTTTTTQAPTTSITESIKFETYLALESKVDNMAADLKDLKAQILNQTCSNKSPMDNNHCEEFRENLMNQTEIIERIDNRTEAMDTRMEIFEENVENFKMSALREILQTKAAVKEGHHGLMTSLNFKVDKLEKQIKEQNRKMEENMAKMEENMAKMEENMAKIMKALNISG